MRILAIDTALGACAACVIEAGPAGDELISAETLLLERGHAEALLPLVERVVAGSVFGSAQEGFAALARVAVTVGPGSFTGLRVGLAAARAIALATNVPAVGVSTLAACLAPLIARQDPRQPVLAAAIDARHGHIYFQAATTSGRELVSPRHISLKEAARQLGTGAVILAGNAAHLLAEEATAIGLDVTFAQDATAPDIRWVARLGAAADVLTALPTPLYLRGADAKPQDRARLPLR